MTNRVLTALQTWLPLWSIVLAAACTAARPPGSIATPTSAPGVLPAADAVPDAPRGRLDADADASEPADGTPDLEVSEAGPDPAASPPLGASGFRLGWDRVGADIGADHFSLHLPADLWGLLEPPKVAGRVPAALDLTLIWPLPDHPTPDLFPYDLAPRAWRELSTWEQIGVVVQTASTIAGVIYLLYRIF